MAELTVRKIVVTTAACLGVRATALSAYAGCAGREPTAATIADSVVATVEVALWAARIAATGPAVTAIATGDAPRSAAASARGRCSTRPSSAASNSRSSAGTQGDSVVTCAATNRLVTGRSSSRAVRRCACGSIALLSAQGTIAGRSICRAATMRCACDACAGSRIAGLVRTARREPNR